MWNESQREHPAPHPICDLLRQLRKASGLSLAKIEEKYGISGVVLASYERGDREPPMRKIDSALNIFGYRLAAVPISEDRVRVPADLAATLRSIADQLERTQHDLPELPPAAPQP